MTLRKKLRNIHIIYFPYVFVNGILKAKTTKNIHTLLLFIGYPRSGSSALASILDAHKNILISHELHALKFINKGYQKNQLFWLINKNSRLSARRNRISSNYPGIINSQFNGRAFPCQVIGDKKAGGSSAEIDLNPLVIDKLLSRYPVNIKFLHVVRNPYDMITTQAYGGNNVQKNIDRSDIENAIKFCFKKIDTIENLVQKRPDLDLFHIKHEALIAAPNKTLTGILNWVGADIYNGYLTACTQYLFKHPHQSRHKFNWPYDLKQQVDKKISQVSFLQGYSFD